MKTAEPNAAMSAPSPTIESFSQTNYPKVLPGHLEKLAIVYVRQSSPTQVLEHRESTARQYAFADQPRRYDCIPDLSFEPCFGDFCPPVDRYN